MTPDQQSRLIIDLTGLIRERALVSARQGRIPDTWGGMELRQLIADIAASETYGDRLKGYRRREYDNDCAVLGLY